MITMKKMLIISHEAERNGAPILILNLAQLLKKKNWAIDFLLKHDGDLSKDFSDCGRTSILYKQPSQTISGKIINRFRAQLIKAKMKSSITSYDIVLSNTIVNGDLHFILKKHKKVYTYVHELMTTIKEYTTKKTLANVFNHTKILIYPSEAVKNLLEHQLGLTNPECRYLPYYIPDHFLKKQKARDETRKTFGFADSDFIVGGMGVLSRRKGIDLFLFTAKKLLQINSEIKFIWCGGDPATTEWLTFKTDIERMGLQNNVCMAAGQPESWKIMSAFDVFYLSSREDAYPLVAIEAAMMKLPVVYFEGSGGVQEFIQNDAGVAVKYMDAEDASEKIIELIGNKQLYSLSSEKAREKYMSRHSDKIVLNFIDKVFP